MVNPYLFFLCFISFERKLSFGIVMARPYLMPHMPKPGHLGTFPPLFYRPKKIMVYINWQKNEAAEKKETFFFFSFRSITSPIRFAKSWESVLKAEKIQESLPKAEKVWESVRKCAKSWGSLLKAEKLC